MSKDKEYKVFSDEPASQAFWDMLDSEGCGSEDVECQSCGRMVWASNPDRFNCDSWDFDSMEERESVERSLEREEQERREDPRCHCVEDQDAIWHCFYFGHHLVHGCPCNYAGRLEKTLIIHETAMAMFLSWRKVQLTQEILAIETGQGDSVALREQLDDAVAEFRAVKLKAGERAIFL